MIKKSLLHIDRINEKLSKFDLVVSILIFFQFLFAINVILAYVNEFYFQYSMGAVLSFSPNDPPAYVNLDKYIPSIWGVHFFGDFLLTLHWSQQINPWLLGYLVNYPPLPIKIVGLFNFLSFSFALKCYLFFLLISLVMPFVVLYAKFKRVIFLAIVFSLGLLNFPLLTTIDRGNIIGFLPLLMFLAAVAILQSKYYIAGILIALGTSIKIYPIILLAIFISNKKWKELILSLLLSIIGIFGLLATYPGNKYKTIVQFVNGFLGFVKPNSDFNQANINILTCRNYSFTGGFIRILDKLELTRISSLVQSHTILISIFALTLTCFLIFSQFTETWLKIVLALSAFTFVPTLAFSYSFSWAIAAIALIFYNYEKNKSNSSAELNKSLSQHWIAAFFLIPVLIPWSFVDTNYPIVCGANYFPIIYSVITIVSFALLYSREISLRFKFTENKTKF